MAKLAPTTTQIEFNDDTAQLLTALIDRLNTAETEAERDRSGDDAPHVRAQLADTRDTVNRQAQELRLERNAARRLGEQLANLADSWANQAQTAPYWDLAEIFHACGEELREVLADEAGL